MKASLRFLITIGVATILYFPLAANSQTAAPSSKEEFTPKYDLAGHWVEDGDPIPSTITRNGKHIVGTFNNQNYEHTIEGDYINPTTVEGNVTRRNRADQTVTTTHVTWVLLSPDLVRMYWIALDSNSDLKMGQKGSAYNRRVSDSQTLAPQPPAPVAPLAKTPPLAPPIEPPPAPKPADPMANID